jgi:hypothetical protein
MTCWPQARDPVGERLRELHLDVRVLGRIDDDHAVLVEQARSPSTRSRRMPRLAAQQGHRSAMIVACDRRFAPSEAPFGRRADVS